NVDFLHLSAGSRMIDKGTDVGLPYLGTAPDLGAYEYGATSTGGASGTGGTTAASGGGSGTSATGGAPGAGGTVSATGGAGGTSGETASGGCSCALDDASGRAPVALVLLAIGGLSSSRRRAGRRR